MIKMPYENEKREINVLLICYDPGLVRTEKCCLEVQGGLCVATALSNDEALVKIEKMRPDVIVGDFAGFLVQDRASGFELVRTLRSQGNKTPFIVFSYDDGKDLIDDIRELGAIGFVAKSSDISITYSMLKNRIVSIISSHG
jgi:DNA-binding NarL/FixJ family response regulator